MKIYRCMHDIEAMCNEHWRQLLLIWFINYLPLTKFHIVNRVWAISTLIITSCCTCHNYICNFFWMAFWRGHPCPVDTFSSFDKIVSDLDTNTPENWDCKDSVYCYPAAGQIITWNLKIIPDSRIRNIISKGPKYRYLSNTNFCCLEWILQSVV